MDKQALTLIAFLEGKKFANCTVTRCWLYANIVRFLLLKSSTENLLNAKIFEGATWLRCFLQTK